MDDVSKCWGGHGRTAPAPFMRHKTQFNFDALSIAFGMPEETSCTRISPIHNNISEKKTQKKIRNTENRIHKRTRVLKQPTYSMTKA